jgi:opacity protein-like surface antigen
MPACRLIGSALLAWWVIAGAGLAPARAEGVVVAKFSDKSGKRLGAKVRAALVDALTERGLQLVPFDGYQKAARKRHVSPRRMFNPPAVRKVSQALQLDGVVLGHVSRVRGRYAVQVRLLGPEGQLLWSETYRERRPVVDARKLKHAAEQILEKIGAPGVAKAPEPEPEPTAEPAPEPEGTPRLEEAPAMGKPSSKPPLEPASRAGERDWAAEEREPAPTPARAERAPAADTRAEPAPPAEHALTPAHDAFLAVGPSMHLRSGLKPTHSASLFPGLRIDGQLLLATFLDRGFARGLGLFLDLDLSLGLEYGYRSAAERWSAQQVQGQGGLLYRLDFDVTTHPTLLLHLGFGGTSCSIDADVDQVVSASYLYPELGLGLNIFLWQPYLRLGASFTFLVPVIAGDEIGGTGWGWSLGAGLDAALFDFLHLGLGYEVSQMRLDEDTMGQVSDTYQAFFLRLGYAFR